MVLARVWCGGRGVGGVVGQGCVWVGVMGCGGCGWKSGAAGLMLIVLVAMTASLVVGDGVGWGWTLSGVVWLGWSGCWLCGWWGEVGGEDGGGVWVGVGRGDCDQGWSGGWTDVTRVRTMSVIIIQCGVSVVWGREGGR